MNVAAHQEKEKNEKTGKRKQLTNLNGLCAALLQSFREQHAEKMVCVSGVLEVTGTFGKANSHFDPTQTSSETTTPRQDGC